MHRNLHSRLTRQIVQPLRLAHLGLQVSRLIRTAYGPLDLHGLEPGQVDEVERDALDAFRRSLK